MEFLPDLFCLCFAAVLKGPKSAQIRSFLFHSLFFNEVDFSLVSVFFHGSIFKPFTSNFPISHPLSLFRHDASSSDCLHTPLPNPPQINPFLMDKDLSNSSKFKSNMFRRSFLPHLRKSSLTLKLTGWSFIKYHGIFCVGAGLSEIER